MSYMRAYAIGLYVFYEHDLLLFRKDLSSFNFKIKCAKVMYFIYYLFKGGSAHGSAYRKVFKNRVFSTCAYPFGPHDFLTFSKNA